MRRVKAKQQIVARGGLTLIELVLVLIIIATLAGLIIPNIGMLGRTADMAASASNQSNLAQNIQLYFTLQKRFPLGMDSLLVSDGAAPSAVYLPQDLDSDGNQDIGLPDSGPHLDRSLFMGTLASSSGYDRSFTRSGFEYVFDHDTTIINSNDSAVFQRALSGSIPVAEVYTNTGSESADQLALARKLYPGTDGAVPSDVRLVALGIGPRHHMVPQTVLNAPIYPGCDGSYYGRYVAIFRVYASGERADLAGVVDSYGRAPDYTQQQFTESLPNNSRRG